MGQISSLPPLPLTKSVSTTTQLCISRPSNVQQCCPFVLPHLCRLCRSGADDSCVDWQSLHTGILNRTAWTLAFLRAASLFTFPLRSEDQLKQIMSSFCVSSETEEAFVRVEARLCHPRLQRAISSGHNCRTFAYCHNGFWVFLVEKYVLKASFGNRNMRDLI